MRKVLEKIDDWVVLNQGEGGGGEGGGGGGVFFFKQKTAYEI